jgi:hypothetical protein
MKARGALAVVLIASAAAVSGWAGALFGRRYERNQFCCAVPRSANILLSAKETFKLVTFPSQIGLDKWVSETVFPGLTNGVFLDVGSGEGVIGSNTFAIERKGWTGICIEPFPSHMQGRTCQLF